MKNKYSIIFLLLLLLCLFSSRAFAEANDVIKATIQSSPEKFDKPGNFEVNITITNVGNETIGPVTLYSPDGKRVLDFGENGEASIAEGSQLNYTGTWTLKQSDLEKGEIKYYIKYPLKQSDGSTSQQNKSLSAKFEYTKASGDLVIEREITPMAAKKGQKVSIIYTVKNTGTEPVKSFSLSENSNISKTAKTIASIAPEAEEIIEFTVTMGTKNLKSQGKATWKVGKANKNKTFDAATITYGEAKLSAKLNSSDTGILAGAQVTLNLTITNSGTVSYDSITVTEPTLGITEEIESLAAGASTTYSKEIVVNENSKYKFTINAKDSTGDSLEISSNEVEIKTILESQQLNLSVQASADKEVFYDDGGRIKFTISVTNNSISDVKNVAIYQRDVKVYTFSLIAAGQTKTVARDFTLSQSGKYRFDARAKNVINEEINFEGNEIYIEVIAPTAVPVIITPSPLPPLVTIAPKTWEDAPESFEQTGRLLNTLARISAGIAGFLIVTIGVSLALRFNFLKHGKNIQASIQNIKKRDYYREAAVEEISYVRKPKFEPLAEAAPVDKEIIEEAPFADEVLPSNNQSETAQNEYPNNYRRRSPGDSL